MEVDLNVIVTLIILHDDQKIKSLQINFIVDILLIN